mgnify:CR=1 FL=1
MGRTVGETSAHAEKAAKKAVDSVSNTESKNEGDNNSGGNNHTTTTQNNNQSDGVVNNSGGSPRGSSNVFGIGGTPDNPNPYTTEAQYEFRQLTQNFASFLDSSLGKLTQAVAETVGGTDRSVSQELDNGINEDGHGDGENPQADGNCVMVGHTQNCFYNKDISESIDEETQADPSTNTEYGDRPDWDDNTFNVADAENQDMPYGTWDDTEVNTEGKDTGFVSPEPTSPSDHVDSLTWLKTLGILPVLAIGGGIIYFARRKKR